MAPAAKSKPKVKSSGKVNAKDKVLVKPKKLNGSSGVAGSAYNPESGAFHVLEETDDHSGGSSLGAGAEYDSISNNDSCSVESEDQHKEKLQSSIARLEQNTPGPDNDKREKIRQKNEKKHQRQKERRAQDLHDRCSGYLMSRKLETLAQQLVGMGFTLERATMALIVNDGRLEQSVAWLFESGEESISAQQKNSTSDSGSNLKIDITEELARVAEMEVKFKCSKQEVEREIVAHEGDLDKAADALRTLYPEHAGAPPHPEELGNAPVGNNSKPLDPASIVNTRFQVKPTGVAVPMAFQQRRDIMAGPPTLADFSNRNVQTSRRILPPKTGAPDWARPLQQAVPQLQKQWVMSSTSNPMPSYSVASSSQADALLTKIEGARYVVLPSTEGKTLQGATLREPVMMMQRPQSVNVTKHSQPGVNSVSTSLSTTPGWPQNGIDSTDLLKANGTLSHLQSMSLNPGNSAMLHYNHQPQYQPFQVDSANGGVSRIKTAGTRSSSATLTVPTSLGLFPVRSSTGTPGSTSYVDWSMGDSMPLCDYRNVDWSMNIAPPSVPKHDGFWNEAAGHSKNNMNLNDEWAGMPKMNGSKVTMSPGMYSGLQDGPPTPFNQIRRASPSTGSQEWTSLATANDLLGMSRQFTTPSR